MKKVIIITLGMTLCIVQGHAQSVNSKQANDAFEEFRQSVHSDFEEFRKQCMDDFVTFIRNPWKEFEENKNKSLPRENQVPPVVMPREDKKPLLDNKKVIIDQVIAPPTITPQPSPINPIKEIPIVKEQHVDFSFFGTVAKVRCHEDCRFKLDSTDENSVANAFERLSSENTDNMLYDCLRLRQEMSLCDWAYLQMLDSLSQTVCGQKSNEAVILMAYLYMQSGYKMRMASAENKLYMLFASKHYLFNRISYIVDGCSYYGIEELPARLHIAQVAFPKEQELSFLITSEQKFDVVSSNKRELASRKYPNFKFMVSVNKNLLDFYSTYPTSMLNDEIMTRWAMYANVPMQKEVKDNVYPGLKEKMKGLSQEEAVNRLLDLVQTGFVYEFDDKVWGRDRAFFSEESLFYPYCDCEDRSILLSRLVRDLLGLKTILVFYPRHLAMAVHFTEDVKGDYILLQGEKYTICDPTYINAPIGMTMPNMDNSRAKVILLQ